MRSLLSYSGSIENRITFYHLAAFLVTLPFDRFYSQLVLISLAVHTLIHLKRNKLKPFPYREIVILSSVLILTLIGIIYSPEKNQGFKDVQRQLAIGLFPLLLFLSRNVLQEARNKLLYLFSITCSVVIVYLFINALILINEKSLSLKSIFSLGFMNHNFSAPIDIHATYLSLYIAICLVFLAWNFLSQQSNWGKALHIVGMIILSAGLLQLASKSVLIGLSVSTVCIPFFMPRGDQRTRFIIVSLLVALIAILGILNIDSFRKRYVGGLKDDLTQASIDNEMLEPRISRWRLTWEQVKERIIIGHGSGTEKKVLKETYFNNRLYNSYLHELNAHNQFLSIWLKNGIIGLVFFLATLAFGFLRARRNQDLLFFSFMILITIAGFSENILDVNKGIFFYSFFFSFFVFTGKPFRDNFRLEQQNPD